MSVAASGRFAAWGYTDGVVIAIDTETDTVWRFSGHRVAVGSIAIDEHRARVISSGGGEIRVWSLTPSPLSPVDRVPCTIYNLAPSLDRTQSLFDCDDGALRLWSLASGKIQEVHRHGNTASGVAWLRDTACSAGLDRRVICTGPDGVAREILSGTGAIQRLKASPDHARIVIVTEDGTHREFDGTLRTLFTHDAKPYQVAFSPDGRWLASGAADGSVIVWDVSERRVRSKTMAHTEMVASLGWRGDELWTASFDGTLKHWRNEETVLRLMDTVRERGRLRLLRLLDDGWVANVGKGELRIERATPAGRLRLDLDRHVESIEVSRDGRYVAASLSGEVIVIDQLQHALASLPIQSGGLGYIGFANQSSLVISKADGLFMTDLSALDFERFDPASVN